MARRPFDPSDQGWTKVEYRQGDIARSRSSRCPGRRRRHRRPPRIHHHGFAGRQRSGQPGRNPQRIRGNGGGPSTPAACLHLIRRRLRLPLRQSRPHHRGSTDEGLARALLLRAEIGLRSHPRRNHVRLRCSRSSCCGRASLPGRRPLRSPKRCRGTDFPTRCGRCRGQWPALKPPFPDPGTPVQLVHHDDVAAAIALAATTSAPPGAYNLAADGVLSMSDVGAALGARPVPVPRLVVSAASEVIARVPFLPSGLEWLHAGRTSTVMDTRKAKSQLGWTPKYTAAETLSGLAESI